MSRPLRAKPQKGPKTAWQVARGQLLYWHMILTLQHLIEKIPEGYETRAPGVFLHPYYVGQFQLRLAPLVGGGSVTGPGLDNVMRPLLREAQENVNQKHISGDQALGYLMEELPRRLATLAASKSDFEARMKIGGPRSEGQEGDQNCTKTRDDGTFLDVFTCEETSRKVHHELAYWVPRKPS